MRRDRPKQGLTVMVRGDDLNGAMRVLKKRMQEEGIFNEIRERTSYKTRNEKRRLEKAAGRRRYLRNQQKLKDSRGY